MSRCAGKGFDCCDSCVNQEIDYECATCTDGDNWEGQDTTDHLAVHELKFTPMKKAA